jgi:hypothetical protein
MDSTRQKNFNDADYLPAYHGGGMPTPEARMANAADYIAYQLGQMNRNLAKLVDLLEKRGS